jgi:hypothetical protein
MQSIRPIRQRILLTLGILSKFKLLNRLFTICVCNKRIKGLQKYIVFGIIPAFSKKKGGYKNRLRPSVTLSCPFHKFVIYQRNLKKLGTIACHNKTICHAQQPGPFLQGQGRTCSFKVNNNKMICHAQHPHPYLKDQGHT